MHVWKYCFSRVILQKLFEISINLQLSICVIICWNHSIIGGHQIENCYWNQYHNHAWTRIVFFTSVHQGLHPLEWNEHCKQNIKSKKIENLTRTEEISLRWIEKCYLIEEKLKILDKNLYIPAQALLKWRLMKFWYGFNQLLHELSMQV